MKYKTFLILFAVVLSGCSDRNRGAPRTEEQQVLEDQSVEDCVRAAIEVRGQPRSQKELQDHFQYCRDVYRGRYSPGGDLF